MPLSGFTRKELLASVVAPVLLAVGAFFMVNVEMPAWAAYASAINVILFALPAFFATRRWLGLRDGFLLWAILGALAVTLESIAILTGFPYGHFGYSELLGYRLFGLAPWTVAFAWTPLLLAGWVISSRLLEHSSAWPLRIILTALITVVFDLVLDPGAVRLGFWRYDDGGLYYGVPVSNFLGWIVTGCVGALVILGFEGWRRPLLPVPIQLTYSAVAIVFFWTAFAVFAALWVPALVGVFTLIALFAAIASFHYRFDDRVVLVDENDRPVATAPKLPTHTENTPLHRAFSVFVFNERGELLLQQRAAAKKTWPLTWSNSCCGHVMLHEKTVDAARRRLKYELGLRRIQLYSVVPDFRYRAEKDGIVENEICPVFVGFTSSEPAANPDEVAETKWVRWSDFLEQAKDTETELSPWATQEAILLEKSPEFKRLFEDRTAGAW
jgi:isopentenyl-diphosphate delta-isomerase type 1